MIRRKINNLTVLMALLLTGALVACAPVPESESMAPSVSTEALKPAQTSESKKTSESEMASGPEDTSHSIILRACQEEVPSDVQVHHVMDDLFNQPGLVSYEVVDLNQFESYYEFVDSYEELLGSEEVPYRIIFIADAPVKNFCYLAVETMTLDDGFGLTVEDTLYQLDSLTPEEPFVVNWTNIGDVGMFRGISFVDEGGVTRTFSFNVSGEDGDLYYIEFEPE